jgi:hypothetical protein
VVTGGFSLWGVGQGVPVRSTVGEPRLWRVPELVFVRELGPYGVFRIPKLPELEDRRKAYMARLDRHDEKIMATLADLAR